MHALRDRYVSVCVRVCVWVRECMCMCNRHVSVCVCVCVCVGRRVSYLSHIGDGCLLFERIF